MGLIDWFDRTRTRVAHEGLAGFGDSLYEVYAGLWRYLGWHFPRGTNIYEREWDTLVILDACRVDVIEEVRSEFGFIEDVERFESVGSMSEEWMAKTFIDDYADEMRRTAYVTGNIFSNRVLSADQFLALDEVWKYAWEDELGIVPARPITERAVATAREMDPDRLIVHYMQPHHPFIGDIRIGGFEADPFGREGRVTVIDALRRREIELATVWEAYRANLRYVLDDVSLLVNNHDAETVVLTADHGEGFGEWGIYDHPAGCLHPVVTDVPWVTTTALDSGRLEPTIEPSDDEDFSPEDRLRKLGYL